MTRKRAKQPKPQIQTATEGIVYDRETGDFAVYLDGELIAFARNYLEGDATLNAIKAERAKMAQEAK